MTRIVIVDDHPIVREGLVAALGEHEVVGVFSTADDALRARPDAEVILLDLELPGTSGLDAIARFEAPVLVLTAYDAQVERALEAGARGFLLKGAAIDEIDRAIRALAKCEQYLDPRLGPRVLASSRAPRLSPRETEVLRLVAAGRSNKEIAAELRISERTAKFHVTSILTKLGAENRAQAAAIAAQRGLA